jgi:hypothetical protein
MHSGSLNGAGLALLPACASSRPPPTPSYADLVTLPALSPAAVINDVTVTSTLNGTPVLGVRPLPAPNETFVTYAGAPFLLNHPCGILYVQESGGATSWNTVDCGDMQSGSGGEYVASSANTCVETLVLFQSWSGACTGSGNCSLTVPTPMNSSSTGVSVVAHFVSQQVTGTCGNMPPFTLTTSTVTTPPTYSPPDPAPGLPNSIHVVLASTSTSCDLQSNPACGTGGSFTVNGITALTAVFGNPGNPFPAQGSVEGVSLSTYGASVNIVPQTQVGCYLISMTNPVQLSFQVYFGSGCTPNNSTNYWQFYSDLSDPTSVDVGTLTVN